MHFASRSYIKEEEDGKSIWRDATYDRGEDDARGDSISYLRDGAVFHGV